MHIILENYKDTLIDLFTRVQALQDNPMGANKECYVIQEILIQRIMDVESEISKAKEQISEAKRLLTNRQTKEEAKTIKTRIDVLYQLIDEYRYVIHVFKCVGDTLVFTYIDRWDIKPMAFKESSGFLTGKKGLKEELEVLKEWFDRGKIAILNDLTNNMRFADITVIDDMHQFSLLEVKSGTQKFKGHKKQTNKRLKLERYLGTDKVEDLHFVGQNMLRVSAHSPEEDHLSEINNLLKQALQIGYSDLLEVEKGLAYYVDTEYSDDRGEKLLRAMNEMMGQPRVVMPRFSKLGYIPFVLSIINPDTAFNFYNGDLVIIVIFDLNAIIDRFASYNLFIEYLNDKTYFFKIKNKSPGNGKLDEMTVSRYLFDRICYEFLSLDWLIEELAYRMNKSLYEALLKHDV